MDGLEDCIQFKYLIVLLLLSHKINKSYKIIKTNMQNGLYYYVGGMASGKCGAGSGSDVLMFSAERK